MSGSRRSRCQGVLEPSAPPPSHPGHHYHHHHHQRRPNQSQRRQRSRNPWVAQESHSTSSSSGRTHHKTRPTEAPVPLHMDHHNQHPGAPRFLQPTFYGLPPSASPPPPERPLLHSHHPPPSLIPSQPHHQHPNAKPHHHHHRPHHGGDSVSTGTAPGSAHSRCDGAGDVGAGGDGGWSGGGCGGQCPALDEFCFHCLRVAFVAGTVTGIGLVIAGAVLRLRLMVLVYIGGLTAIVSLILLGVHCCARRDDAVRRRRIRELQKRRRGGGREGLEAGDGDFSGGQEGIPLRDLGPTQNQPQHLTRVGSSAGAAPLYHGLVLQPPPPPAAFRSAPMTEPSIGGHIEELEIISVTGTSVWRQNEQNRTEIMETHH
ncbi:uncharacterized protein LOC124162194 [Ischnura elegans]|uniref:uncharacterized protein LOC124162194 n=1 Tax=Ischnura elegans TaxID=197161 RepID=UPI001ED8665E|nr:uncharacterized protein LOC124162194 [Ischnura elegans]XP_046394603.1 uncharacterized protein LOC124162194 [Ischnura elegans]